MEWTSARKGWVYQRKKHLLLPTSWSPKYLVLYSGPIPALAVYEQRSDAMPPYAPLLHIELTSGAVSVGTAHGGSGTGGWLSAVSSRRASIAAGLSRRGSFRDLNSAAAKDAASKSYKERVLDEQGFMVMRESGPEQPSLRLCFAVESREERDAWLSDIQKIIDQANRKMVAAAGANIFAARNSAGDAGTGSQLEEAMAGLAVRAASEDLAIVCCGVTVMDHRTVKRILNGAGLGPEGAGEDGEEEIETSQILHSSNSRLIPNSLVPEDLNLKFQQAIIDRRHSTGDDWRRAELRLLKLSANFTQAVSIKVKSVIDALHTSRNALPEGVVHEDALCRVHLVADYQTTGGCEGDEEGRGWLQQEMLASQWVTSQEQAPVHCVLMAGVEYKGFRAVGMLKLPVSAQSTLVLDVADEDADGGVVSEAALAVARELAKALHLLPAYPWRLADGRTIQMALHPSVQLHHIQPQTMAPSSGRMVVGRQAGKIQGGASASAFSPPGYYLLRAGECLPQVVGPDGVLRLARPELMAKAQGPAGCGLLHPEATAAALQPVLMEAINKLAKDLEAGLELLPLDSHNWTEMLHSRGINTGLMGFLAKRLTLPHAQEGLAIEMIARTVKRALRAQLRQTVLHFREVQALLVEEELASMALGAVNALLAPVNEGTRDWKNNLLLAVEGAYGYRIDVETLQGLARLALFMAVQEHCGLQFNQEAILAVREGCPLEPRHFVRFLPRTQTSYKHSLNGSDAEEEEEDIRLEIAAAQQEAGMNGVLMAKQFERLAQATRDETTLRLARSCCPSHHAAMASILLTELDMACARDGLVDIPRASAVYRHAKGLVQAHLGSHHPYQLLIAQRYTSILAQHTSEEDSEAQWEALRVREEMLQDAAKILGRSHATCKAQYKEIGGLQLRLGEWPKAGQNLREALKYAKGVEEKTALGLQLAEALRQQDDLEAALEQVRACSAAIEAEIPRSPADTKLRLLRMQEDVLLRLARLCQALAGQEDEHQIPPSGMLSGEMEKHLCQAIACYERLFDLQRARAESPAEAQQLLTHLQQIVSLKLRLAPPAARAVIQLAGKMQGPTSTAVDAKIMQDLTVKLMGGPVPPVAFMDKLLERAASPETMREAEPELRAIIQFSSAC